MTTPDQPTVTIDKVVYKLADLNENAKNQVVNLRITDQEIVRLQQLLAIANTARAAYANALSAELAKIAPPAATESPTQ